MLMADNVAQEPVGNYVEKPTEVENDLNKFDADFETYQIYPSSLLKPDLNKLRADFSSYKASQDALLAKAQKDLVEQKAASDVFQREAGILSSKLAKASGELQQAKARLDTAATDAQAVNQKLTEEKAARGKAEKENVDLKTQLADAQAANTKLVGEKTALTAEKTQLTATKEQLTTDKARLETQVAGLEGEKADFIRQVTELQQTRSDQAAEIVRDHRQNVGTVIGGVVAAPGNVLKNTLGRIPLVGGPFKVAGEIGATPGNFISDVSKDASLKQGAHSTAKGWDETFAQQDKGKLAITAEQRAKLDALKALPAKKTFQVAKYNPEEVVTILIAGDESKRMEMSRVVMAADRDHNGLSRYEINRIFTVKDVQAPSSPAPTPKGAEMLQKLSSYSDN